MPSKALRFCAAAGCKNMISSGTFCADHVYIERNKSRYYDRKRGSSNARGYNNKWRNYSRWFLRQPGNQFCKLKIDDGCAVIAECVDHIDPPDGPSDPRFWDRNNHQAACIHCNSVKGHRKIIGAYEFGKDVI